MFAQNRNGLQTNKGATYTNLTRNLSMLTTAKAEKQFPYLADPTTKISPAMMLPPLLLSIADA